jgi:predicted metal-dependent phosphoesterase TrpH
LSNIIEVDLHLHTTESDGRLTPTELIEMVVQRGLKVVAVTDHDTTDGLEVAWKSAAAYPELSVIPGIELSTDIPGNEIHILGYHIDYMNQNFQNILVGFRESRLTRAKEMVGRLEELGISVEWERVKEIAGQGAIGRPHIALAMVESGYISQPQEAFEKYLGRNGMAYAERPKQTPAEAVKLILQAGGVPVLAHPAQIEGLDQVIADLKDAGLKGIEVHYAEYDGSTINTLAKLAANYDLLPCGGSDYHAFGTPGEHLPGEMGPPMWVAEELRFLAVGG